MKQHKKRNIRGFSHDFLLPVIVVVAVAGIGGYVMLQRSSAATATQSCTSVTFGRYKNNPVYSKYKHYKPCVQAIQKKVGAKADGIYGDYTQSRVKAWQKNHSITADGVVGPKTWKAMGLKTKYSAKAASGQQTPTQSQAAIAAARKDCQASPGAKWNSVKKTCDYQYQKRLDKQKPKKSCIPGYVLNVNDGSDCVKIGSLCKPPSVDKRWQVRDGRGVCVTTYR